jgi:hypothetical protein
MVFFFFLFFPISFVRLRSFGTNWELLSGGYKWGRKVVDRDIPVLSLPHGVNYFFFWVFYYIRKKRQKEKRETKLCCLLNCAVTQHKQYNQLIAI